jgi:ElaB/YqjD/DUF883 family membrane-anchored ribosome-binding protein
MSDSMQNNEAIETAELLDAEGRVVPESSPATGDVISRVEAFIHDEPVKAVCIALAIGYVIGRLRLIV